MLVGCSQRPDELRIGVAMPLTGPLADEGRSLLQAAQLAAQEINTHGTLTSSLQTPVTIAMVDDKADDDNAARVAQELMQQKVSAVIGHLTSGASIAAAPIYAKGKVAQLTTATHPHFTQMGLPTTFRLVASDAMQAVALARYVHSEYRGRSFALVDDGSVYGKGLADAVASEFKQLNQALAFRKSYGVQSQNFSDLVASVPKEPAPVVITTMELPQVEPLLKQLLTAGLQDAVVVGGDTLKAGPLPADAPKLRRFLSTTPVTGLGEFGSSGKAFAARYRARFKSEPADAAHYAYDAVHLIAQASVKTGSTDPEKIAKTLRKQDFAVPVTSALRFRDDGELRYGAVSLYTANKGAWHLVFRSAQW